MRLKRFLYLNIGLWVISGLMWPTGFSTGRDLFTTLSTVAFTSLAYELFIVPRSAGTRCAQVTRGRV